MKKANKKVAVVTGGSSGIGKATAEYFADKGWVVYELSRRECDNDRVTHITADVTDEQSLKEAFESIYSREGRLDLLVNNAGFGISGAVELTGIDEAKKQLDVNFFGTVRSIQQALPFIRKTGGGKIINLSSVAAPLSIPFQAFYSCSKSAINALTLALANELRPFGISVCAVMPGDVSTGFTDAREKSQDDGTLYGDTIKKSVAVMEKDERGGMSPLVVAKTIYKASRRKHPKPLYTAGGKYKIFVVLAKILPARLSNRIVGMLYC